MDRGEFRDKDDGHDEDGDDGDVDVDDVDFLR